MFGKGVLRGALLSAVAVLFVNNELFVSASPFPFNDDAVNQHTIEPRQAENEAPKTPSESDSEKAKATAPALPRLELNPDAEPITPNITVPQIPNIPTIPGFLPGPGFQSPPGLYPPSPYFPDGPGIFGGVPNGFGGPPLDFDPCPEVPTEAPETPEDEKNSKQVKSLNKMQCEFFNMQKKLGEFYKNIENELTELKKLNYNTVARLARLESILRTSSPFNPPF